MGRKGKSQKHTAKELNAKHKAAKEKAGAAGGGGKGAAARKNASAKILMVCKLCKTNQPSVKSMKIHFDAKHPKENWDEHCPIYEAIAGDNKEKNNAKKNQKTHMIGQVKSRAAKQTKKELGGREKAALKKKQMEFLEAQLGNAKIGGKKKSKKSSKKSDEKK
jgi:hypothetical protein